MRDCVPAWVKPVCKIIRSAGLAKIMPLAAHHAEAVSVFGTPEKTSFLAAPHKRPARKLPQREGENPIIPLKGRWVI